MLILKIKHVDEWLCTAKKKCTSIISFPTCWKKNSLPLTDKNIYSKDLMNL